MEHAPVGPRPADAPAGLRDPTPRDGRPLHGGAQGREWIDVVYRGRRIVLGTLPGQYAADTTLLVQTEQSSLSDVPPSSAADASGGRKGRQIENEVLVLRPSDAGTPVVLNTSLSETEPIGTRPSRRSTASRGRAWTPSTPSLSVRLGEPHRALTPHRLGQSG